MKRSARRALPVAASVALFATLAVAASCSTSSKSGPVDASAPSDAASCDAGAACTPQSLMGWMPPAYVHAATARPSACPGTYVQDFYTDCLGPSANTQACNGTWYTGADLAHATCVACLVTKSTAQSWGPIVDYGGGTLSINVAGCIERLDPNGLACATSVQAADECPHQACDAACPVNPNDSESFTKWEACASYVEGCGDCSSYTKDAACAAAEDAGPAAACVRGTQFQDLYDAIAPLFCGSADGG